MGIWKRKLHAQLYFMWTTIYLHFETTFLNILWNHEYFCKDLPVKHAVVLQVLHSPATLHIFNHMVLQKLLQELNRLLPGDIRAKIAVALKQLVQPIHCSRSSEAGRVVSEVLAVLPKGHASPKQTCHFIPLKENKDRFLDISNKIIMLMSQFRKKKVEIKTKVNN